MGWDRGNMPGSLQRQMVHRQDRAVPTEGYLSSLNQLSGEYLLALARSGEVDDVQGSVTPESIDVMNRFGIEPGSPANGPFFVSVPMEYSADLVPGTPNPLRR